MCDDERPNNSSEMGFSLYHSLVHLKSYFMRSPANSQISIPCFWIPTGTPQHPFSFVLLLPHRAVPFLAPLQLTTSCPALQHSEQQCWCWDQGPRVPSDTTAVCTTCSLQPRASACCANSHQRRRAHQGSKPVFPFCWRIIRCVQ